MILNKKNDLLKIIAMVTMLIDHIGVLFFPGEDIYRTIGRIAFPIFAYFLATGFRYTSSKIKYVKRLAIFGLIAQLPYMYLNTEVEFHYLGYNVILLFLYAVGMLYVFEQMRTAKKEHKNIQFQLYLLAFLFIVLLPEMMGFWIPGFYLSYGTYGLVLILLFYLFYKKPLWLLLIFPVFSFVFAYLRGVGVLVEYYDQAYFEALINVPTVMKNLIEYKDGLATLQGYFFQARSFLGLIVVLVFASFQFELKMPRYFLYIFYPAHIVILILIKVIIS